MSATAGHRHSVPRHLIISEPQHKIGATVFYLDRSSRIGYERVRITEPRLLGDAVSDLVHDASGLAVAPNESPRLAVNRHDSQRFAHGRHGECHSHGNSKASGKYGFHWIALGARCFSYCVHAYQRSSRSSMPHFFAV